MEQHDYRDQQGQLPPEIYRRRRLVAIIAIVIVVILIVWGIVAAVTKHKDGKDDAGSSTVTSTSTVAEKDSNAADCSSDDLQFEAQVGRPNVAQGNDLPLIMKITNKSKKSCKAEMGAAHQRYEIYTIKANRPVWKSEICYTSAEDRKEVLAPNESRRFTVSWEGTRQNSDGNCSAQAAAVVPGAYKLYTLLDSEMGEPATFNVLPAGEDDSAGTDEDESSTTPSSQAEYGTEQGTGQGTEQQKQSSKKSTVKSSTTQKSPVHSSKKKNKSHTMRGKSQSKRHSE